MYACMYACMHVRTYVCMYASMNACMCAFVCVCVSLFPLWGHLSEYTYKSRKTKHCRNGKANNLASLTPRLGSMIIYENPIHLAELSGFLILNDHF